MKTNDNKILSHSVWNCKYHIVFAPKYRVSLSNIWNGVKKELNRRKITERSHWSVIRIPQVLF